MAWPGRRHCHWDNWIHLRLVAQLKYPSSGTCLPTIVPVLGWPPLKSETEDGASKDQGQRTNFQRSLSYMPVFAMVLRSTIHNRQGCRGRRGSRGADEAHILSRLGGAEVHVAGVDDDARGHGLRRATPRSRPLLSCPSPRPTGSGRQLVKPLPNRMQDKIDTNRDAKYEDVCSWALH